MKKTKILIDGRLLEGGPNGIRRYIEVFANILSNNGYEIYIAVPGIPAQDINLDPKISVIKLPKNKLINQFYLNKNLIKKTNVDIYWGPAHRLPFGKLNVPSVLTIHDLAFKSVPSKLKWRTLIAEKLFFSSSVRKASKVIAVSEFTKNEITKYYPQHSHKVHRIYNLIDHHKFPQNNVLQKVSNWQHGHLLHVGTIEPRKNVIKLIEAFLELPPNTQKQFPLNLAGNWGWISDKEKTYIQFLASKGQVNLVIGPSDNTLAQLYESCHCLISLSIYEGFGLPVLEALNYNKPSIVTKGSAQAEIAGPACFEVTANDTDEILKAIRTICSDKSAYNRLRVAASERKDAFLTSLAIQTFEHLVHSIMSKDKQ